MKQKRNILIIAACLTVLIVGVIAGRYYAAKDTGYPVRVLNFNDLENVNLNWQGTEPQDVFGGTVLFPYQGGTGIASYSVGELIYASGPGTLSRLLASGSEGNVLTFSSGLPTWAAATGGTGAALPHSILDSDWHSDALLASVSAGSLIIGDATPKWSELTIGASQSFLMSDGTTAFWADYVDANTTYTAGDMLTLTGTDFDIDDPFTVVTLTGTHVSSSEDFTTPSGQITSLSATTLNFPDDSIAETDISFSTACAAGSHYYLNGTNLACETDDDTTYTGGDHLTLTGTDFDVDDDFLLNTGDTGTWVSISADADIVDLNATSASFGTIYAGTWNGTKIDISDYTNLTAGDHIDLTDDDLDVLDDFLLNTGDTGTWVSISADADILDLNATSASFGTVNGAGLADCDTAATSKLLWSDTGVFSCGTDTNTTYTATDPLFLTGTAFDIDYASAGGGGYILGTTWEDFNGKLSSLSIDTSAEIITIVGDETGSNHLVFDTSPEFTTSFTTTGVFAINPGGALTIGDNGDTLYLNSSDWDISATGDLTNIGAITMDGTLTGVAIQASGSFESDSTASLSGQMSMNVASVSGAFYADSSINFTNLKNCDTIDTNATGVLACGTDATAAGGTTPHGLLYSDIHNDATNASVSANALIYGGETTWQSFAITATSASFLVFNGTSVAWTDFDIPTGTIDTFTSDHATISDDLGLGAAGVYFSQDGDGLLSIAGRGNGSDEDLTFNFDDTANNVDITTTTGVTDIHLNDLGIYVDGVASVSGNLDLNSTGLLINIGNAGTDFTSGGGLTLVATGLLNVGIASISGDTDIGDLNATSASFTGDIQVADILVTGGNINTGNIALVVGDATTDTIQFYTDGTGNGEYTFSADGIGDADIDWGSGAGQVDLADITGGVSGASVWDFGGATSFEIVNAAAPTIDTLGEIGIDTTTDQIVIFGTDGETAFTASRGYGFGVASGSATLLVDGPQLFWDFTIGSASCKSGNVAGEIYIIDVYECSNTGTCGEHINTASVSCNLDWTSFLLNDKLGDLGDSYQFKIQSVNDTAENTDQVILNFGGTATRK